MRRKHCEITDPNQLTRILNTATIGRLATIGTDGYPYVTPVNYVYYRGRVCFHSALQGEKLDNIHRDPRVGFQVDIPLAYIDGGFNPAGGPCKLHQFYHCVIIRGEARVLSDGVHKLAVLNALVAKHEGARPFVPLTQDSPAVKACAVVEIRPQRMTGKSDLAQNKSVDERRALAGYLQTRGHAGDRETIAAMGLDNDAGQ
jgi:nitroimidazol reductase NimA-like FMN-containing flavoprotein (pyridoxamine 5'-phosphate oxidase superfamily)